MVIAYRGKLKLRRAAFLKQLALRCLQRRFTGFDVPALRLPGFALFVAAQEKLALVFGKHDDVFVVFKRAKGADRAVWFYLLPPKTLQQFFHAISHLFNASPAKRMSSASSSSCAGIRLAICAIIE